MEVFCTKESSGCIQESILFATLEMDTIGLQMKFPEGFYRMEDGKRHRYYPWKGRPDMVWENHEGVQVTGQAAGQKVKISEIVPAAEAARKMTENIFPQYRFSPVYLCETGELPIGWFRMQMQDRGMEHIKAFTVIDHEMVMLTFTYPDAEEIKWKSIILSSFGTWREFHGAD